MNRLTIWTFATLGLVMATAAVAQGARGRFQAPASRDSYPTWTLPEQFKHDVFTFVRIQYDSGGSSRRGSNWDNDFPDCDWNFSARLHQRQQHVEGARTKVDRVTIQEQFAAVRQ